MTLTTDSWELPSHLAGDLLHMKGRPGRESVPAEETGKDAQVITHPKWRIRRGPAAPAPAPVESVLQDWSEIAPPTEDDLAKYHRGDLVSQGHIDRLRAEGFEPDEDGSWHRRVTQANGEPIAAHHILTYQPGYRRPTNGERAPWILSTDPETVGIAFPSLHGAVSAANADRDQVRRMSKVGSFLSALMTKTAVEKTPAQIAAEKWLAENDDQFEHWEPNPHDYTYSDFTDVAGQSFGDDDEGTSHVLPGSEYDFGNNQGWEDQGGWSPTDDESGDPEPHEQDLADLGFNWQHRGDPNTTPVGEHQEGEYVRHQHDPEGRHIATHTIRRVPYSNTWHVESTDPSDSNFAYESSEHRFPGEAISQYHDNAERAFLPTRGYEPHHGRSGAITHWTRTDTDPHSGQTYQHEISNQPSEGTGWLGNTVSEGMIAPSHGINPLRRHDLADVVREHDRTGRGLHPGGSQDNRVTKDELLSHPSVARLGTPRRVSDGFYGDNKVGSASWSWSHPHWPHPINAEATYNWDKGGYDFKYTSDGEWLAASHNHVPDGAPIHVPGRQTRLF